VLLNVTVGFVLSFPYAVSSVFDVSVTVVAFVVALAGLFPLTFVHPLHAYPLAVLTVASILTCCPYLYVFASVVLVHPLLTAVIHIDVFNFNVTELLANHAL
jgi:hypothetical protein